MSSIRKSTATLALGLIVLGVGCTKKDPNPKPALDNRPIATDQAMERRQWPEQTSTYANTAVPAGPDRTPYEPTSADYGYLLDTPLFLVNAVVWPFTYFQTGINEDVQNTSGASIDRGYTAIPQDKYYTTGLGEDYNPNVSGTTGGARGAGGAAGSR